MTLPASRRPLPVDLVLAGALLVTYAWFYQGGFSNQNSRFDLSLAIAFEHRTAIDTFAANTIDKVSHGGHTFLEKAPGASWLALPVPLVASLFCTTQDLLAEPWRADLLLWAATVASASLLTALAAVAFRRTLHLLKPDQGERAQAAIAAVVFGATPLPTYATMLFGHALAASWLTLAQYQLLKAARGPDAGRLLRRAALGWTALGAAVLTEYPTVMPAAGIAVGALSSCTSPERRRTLLSTSPLAALGVAGILAHNRLTFASPFAMGYGKLAGTQFGGGMSRGLFGITLPSPYTIGQLLFGTYRGLFVYAPVLAVTTACYAFWPRRMLLRTAAPLLAGALGLVALISGYSYWQGGTCFGPRHIVAIIPTLGLGAAYIPRAWLRSPLTVGAVAASLFVAQLGTVITPNVTEFALAPLTDAYLPLLRAGKVSISPITFLSAAAENGARHAHYTRYPWAAFNVGELVGLRGYASVAPLAVLWAAVAVRLLPRFRPSARAALVTPNADARGS